MLNRIYYRMLVIFLSLVIIPIVLIGGILGFQSIDNLDQQSIILQEEIMQRVGEDIQHFLELRINEISHLNDIYGLSIADNEQQDALLANLLQHEQNYQEFILLDSEGNEVSRVARADDVTGPNQVNWLEQESFRRAMGGEIYVGEMYFHPGIREPLLPIVIPFVDLRAEDVSHILVAQLRFRPIWNLLEDVELPYDGDVYLTNAEGRIVAHKQASYVLQNRHVDLLSLDEYNIGLLGQDVIKTKSSIEFNNQTFHVVIEHAIDAVRQPVNLIFQVTVTTIIVFLVLAIATITVVTRRIVQPIEALAKASRALSEGDFSQRVEVSGRDEIYELAEAFNQMAMQVQRLLTDLQQENIDRRQAEAEVRQLNIELEERVKQRTRSLEIANKELDDFAYIVSHDLKAPLRGIGQLVDWLVADYMDEEDETGREMAELLLSRVQRMHNLIDGILHYSRVGRVQDNEMVIDLNVLVKNTIDMIGPPESIIISVQPSLPTIKGDETQWIQLFQNLISNAIKYMDKAEGKVDISCDEEGDFWYFKIEDNGPGIEGKYHDKIFQIFQTLSSRDEVESTGVGLSLVRKIVQNWNGDIRIESTPGQGSTFIVKIPNGNE